jgi:adenylate kinase
MKASRRGQVEFADVEARSNQDSEFGERVNTSQAPGADQIPNPKSEAPLALVLFGSPGSGKGTQSKLLVNALGIPQISTGDMLREHVRLGNSVGTAVQEKMKAGVLVKDDVVNRLVEERLKQPDCRRGFILDGYPRTRAQAETLCGVLKGGGFHPVVVHLLVDYNVIIARLTGRRQCPVCGALYNATSKPPKVPGVCDLDGTALVVREDDREPVVRERLDEYEKQTRPLIDYFREKGNGLYEIDASQEKPEVLFRKILGLIRKQ